MDLAIDAAGKVIEQKLDRDQHVQLVERFLSETSAAGDGRR